MVCSEPFHQLLPHDLENRAQEQTTKDKSDIILLKTLTEDRHMAETNPPVHLYTIILMHLTQLEWQQAALNVEIAGI